MKCRFIHTVPIRAIAYRLMFLWVWFAPGVIPAQQIIPIMEFSSPAGSLEKASEQFKSKGVKSSEELTMKLNQLMATLHGDGYLTASVDTMIRGNDTCWIYIDVGRHYTATRIIYQEEDIPLMTMAGAKSAREHAGYSPSGTLGAAVRYLNQQGYPLAKIIVQDFSETNDTLTALVTVERGRHYVWDTIEIRGDATVSNVVLQKLLRIREGESFNPVLLEDVEDNIATLPFLKMQGPYSLILTESGKARLVLNLSRGRASGFNGVIGFGPDKSNPQKLIFSGDVSLKLLNALRLAEEMEMQWEGIQGDQKLLMRYRQPYLPLLPFGVRYSFDFLKKGELYYTLDQKGGALIRSGAGSYFSLYFQQKNSKVLDREIYEQYTVLPPWTDYVATGFGLEYRFTRLDYPQNPGRGIALLGDLSAGKKKILSSSDIPDELLSSIETEQKQLSADLSLIGYYPVSPRWVINGRLTGASLYNRFSLENELFFLGGINSLRGFEERSLPASSYAASTLEIRYRFERDSHLKVFIDAAWYEKKLKDSYLHDTPLGFGVGVAFPTPAGVLNVHYAYGIQQGNPLDLKTGRLHFGLISQF